MTPQFIEWVVLSDGRTMKLLLGNRGVGMYGDPDEQKDCTLPRGQYNACLDLQEMLKSFAIISQKFLILYIILH